MKKLFVILTILCSIYATSTYAQSKPPVLVLSSFQSSFDKAANITWSTAKDLYRADFILEDQKISAFFNEDGDLIASSRDVTLLQIPMSLKSNLKKQFRDYEVSSLFEVNKEDGIVYYATLANSKSRLMLESSSSGDWIANKKTIY
ncbi:MAG: hypothetical protein JWM28_1811 [Chitinophagaceae bacterium]|nr:hypothetical protein [Chitinophagaceae bacterium]